MQQPEAGGTARRDAQGNLLPGEYDARGNRIDHPDTTPQNLAEMEGQRPAARPPVAAPQTMVKPLYNFPPAPGQPAPTPPPPPGGRAPVDIPNLRRTGAGYTSTDASGRSAAVTPSFDQMMHERTANPSHSNAYQNTTRGEVIGNGQTTQYDRQGFPVTSTEVAGDPGSGGSAQVISPMSQTEMRQTERTYAPKDSTGAPAPVQGSVKPPAPAALPSQNGGMSKITDPEKFHQWYNPEKPSADGIGGKAGGSWDADKPAAAPAPPTAPTPGTPPSYKFNAPETPKEMAPSTPTTAGPLTSGAAGLASAAQQFPGPSVVNKAVDAAGAALRTKINPTGPGGIIDKLTGPDATTPAAPPSPLRTAALNPANGPANKTIPGGAGGVGYDSTGQTAQRNPDGSPVSGQDAPKPFNFDTSPLQTAKLNPANDPASKTIPSGAGTDAGYDSTGQTAARDSAGTPVNGQVSEADVHAAHPWLSTVPPDVQAAVMPAIQAHMTGNPATPPAGQTADNGQ